MKIDLMDLTALHVVSAFAANRETTPEERELVAARLDKMCDLAEMLLARGFIKDDDGQLTLTIQDWRRTRGHHGT